MGNNFRKLYSKTGARLRKFLCTGEREKFQGRISGYMEWNILGYNKGAQSNSIRCACCFSMVGIAR